MFKKNSDPFATNHIRHGNLRGARGTPYAAISYHVILKFPITYPTEPPKVLPCTRLDHPNVFGEFICLDLLEDGHWSDQQEKDRRYTGWSTAYSVQSLLVQLQTFLTELAYSDMNSVSRAIKAADGTLPEHSLSFNLFLAPKPHTHTHTHTHLHLRAIRRKKERRREA